MSMLAFRCASMFAAQPVELLLVNSDVKEQADCENGSTV